MTDIQTAIASEENVANEAAKAATQQKQQQTMASVVKEWHGAANKAAMEKKQKTLASVIEQWQDVSNAKESEKDRLARLKAWHVAEMAKMAAIEAEMMAVEAKYNPGGSQRRVDLLAKLGQLKVWHREKMAMMAEVEANIMAAEAKQNGARGNVPVNHEPRITRDSAVNAAISAAEDAVASAMEVSEWGGRVYGVRDVCECVKAVTWEGE